MKMYRILLLSFILTSCTSPKIHNQTDVFLDIEVSSKNAWIGCTDVDPEDENSLMTLYVLDDETTHEFMFRRVQEVDRCLKLEREYRSLTKDASSVRIVGIQPTLKNRELINDRVPEKFKDSKVKKNWTFVRFHTTKGCESYFEGDCSPENYWGGIVPPHD